MASKYFFQQELVHKPMKNVVHYLKHLIVLHSNQVLCFYEGEGEEKGFFELWKAKYTTAFLKFNIVYENYFRYQISYLGIITRPFEYDQESIAFFDSSNSKLFQMFYLDGGALKEVELSLPTQSFKEILQIDFDEYVQEKYLIQCINILHNQKRNLNIVLENLGVFELPTGDACEDAIISSWSSSGKIAEAIIKNVRETLQLEFIDENNIIIYRQLFFSELLEFFIWDCRFSAELSIPIQIKLEVNITIIRCFPWSCDPFLQKQENLKAKQEQNKPGSMQQIAIFANQNNEKYPIVIFAVLNQVMKEVYSFKIQNIINDGPRSMLIDVVWASSEMQYVHFLYMGNDSLPTVTKYNLSENKKMKIYTHLKEGVAKFYFSKKQGCFVINTIKHQTEDEPEQSDEIKNQIKMEEPANLTQFFILPPKIVLWQYMRHMNLIDIYGDKIMQEVLELIWKGETQTKREIQPLIKNKNEHIKFEYIID